MTPSQLRRASGYVVQQDILPGMLTVTEHLTFHAHLRTRSAGGAGPERRRNVASRVESVVRELGLQLVAHSLIGNAMRRGVSGGEKRRVSIAVELLSHPAVLFLDEPTTGLDSTNAVNVVQIVSRIAARGTTVAMSIHQPRLEIFQLLRRVVLLARGGVIVYNGPASEAASYLNAICPPSRSVGGVQSDNPADVMLDVVTSTKPALLAEHFDGSQACAALLGDLAALESRNGDGPMQIRFRVPASPLVQFRILAVRAVRSSLRNPTLLAMHLGLAMAVAGVVGYTYHDVSQYNNETAGVQDRFGIMFFCLTYFSLISLSSLPLWRDEVRIFIHERASGAYGTLAYYAATILCDVAPFRIVPPMLFTLVSYSTVGLAGGGRWTTFMTILILFNLVSSSLCMLMGLLSGSNAVANAAGSLLMLFSLLFAGYLKNVAHFPSGWKLGAYLSPSFYAYNALVKNELETVDGQCFEDHNHNPQATSNYQLDSSPERCFTTHARRPPRTA
mmetsp:Transcript_22969/g.60686  ORF Transcript_22969/g.60686 Transcript_22969/m.60686 type:complete len:503 (-) Transcript_22969:355-1863(-)